MSDEEKKAIELLKKLQKKTPYIIWGDGTPYNKNNQIQTILNLIDNQQKEIEEKSTIIMAGAEKVKQLEKEIKEYKEHYENMKWYYDNQKDNLIHKDKIKELKEKVEKEMISNPYDFSYMINELLEEK